MRHQTESESLSDTLRYPSPTSRPARKENARKERKSASASVRGEWGLQSYVHDGLADSADSEEWLAQAQSDTDSDWIDMQPYIRDVRHAKVNQWFLLGYLCKEAWERDFRASH